MTTLKDWVGRESNPYREEVTEARLSEFAAVARAPSPADLPTFFTRWRFGEFELIDRMGVQLPQVLHGEQDYDFFAPVKAGDTVEFRTRLADCVEKQGKGYILHFLIFATDFLASGRKLATARSTLIYREKTDRAAVTGGAS